MLFKQTHLQGIKSGNIRLAFRKWEKSSVKKGTLLKTSIGLVEIVDMAEITEDRLTDKDARDAGFESKKELMQSLRPGNIGTVYKISVRYHSADPRIEFRQQVLTPGRYEELKARLDRLDKYSRQGNWTKQILLAIKKNPHRRAIEISGLTGFEKEWLKQNIRKLKNLGLTISHEIGYELSPLGNALVEKLLKEK